MIVFTEPKVYLIARPSLVEGGLSGFLAEAGHILKNKAPESPADAVAEVGGRVCYCSFGKLFENTSKFLAHAQKLGHGSIFEHPAFTFGVARCSRGYTHQQVRHRAGFAYSQESTHYIKYSKETARFYVDKYAFARGKELWEKNLGAVIEAYEMAFKVLKDSGDIDRHNCSGAARQLLPQALESKILVSANVRAIRHLVEDRCNRHNTLEIRLVATQVLEIMKVEAPASFQDMDLFVDEDGEKSAKSGKVKL
ncbi:MAG: FAD-dependent thymidylate synthase [Omnitrophica bacterium]|nr:FAD-dependent thymidylate synthase [Candidatus Omnitrophota bacterium]